MTNKEVHKTTQKEFDLFLKQYGFIKQNTSDWVYIKDELLHIVSLYFSYGQERFDFDIAVQPFCVPADNISMYISNRLHDFDGREQVHLWGDCDKDKLMCDIEDAKQVMINDVFPWFNKISDCFDIIRLLENKKAGSFFHISPYFRAELNAQLCFFKHKFGKAYKYAFYSLINSHDISKKEEIKLIMRLAREDVQKMDNYFLNVIDKNKQAWKLKE